MNNDYQDETPKWVVRFYSGLWWLLKALAIVVFLAFCIWLRYRFDKWYINWIME